MTIENNQGKLSPRAPMLRVENDWAGESRYKCSAIYRYMHCPSACQRSSHKIKRIKATIIVSYIYIYTYYNQGWAVFKFFTNTFLYLKKYLLQILSFMSIRIFGKRKVHCSLVFDLLRNSDRNTSIYSDTDIHWIII